VTVWGTGAPLREFLHVDDLARACLYLLEHYDAPEPINVGVGKDLSIRQLAELVSDIIGYEGSIEFDTSKPDGTPRKLLDVSKLHGLGFRPEITLRDGLERTYAWYRQQLATGAIRAAYGLTQLVVSSTSTSTPPRSSVTGMIPSNSIVP